MTHELYSRREFLSRSLSAASLFVLGSSVERLLNALPPANETLTLVDDLLAERVERTRIIEASSWQDLENRLWDQQPELHLNLKRIVGMFGPHVEDHPFKMAYRAARLRNDTSTIHGVIVIRQHDFYGHFRTHLLQQFPSIDRNLLDRSFTELEYLSFILPMEQALRRSARQGIDVPTTVITDIAVLPDSLLDTPIRFRDPAGGDTMIPYNFVGTGEILPWPPSVDWIIYDLEPFAHGTSESRFIDQEPVQTFVQPGWCHEQLHVLGTMDLYRHHLDTTKYILNQHDEVIPLTSHIHGWDQFSIVKADFGGSDIMHTINTPVIEITPITSLQAAISRRQGIYSTMHEGVPQMYPDWRMPYNLLLTDRKSGEDLTPNYVTSYGDLIHTGELDHFRHSHFHGFIDPKWKLYPVPRIGRISELPHGYMFGMDITQQGHTFTLPLPSCFPLLQRLRYPTPSAYDIDFLELHITVDALVANLEWYTSRYNHDNLPLSISVSFLFESEFIEIDRYQGPQNGVMLAYAPLDVHPSLFTQGQESGVVMVWMARINQI